VAALLLGCAHATEAPPSPATAETPAVVATASASAAVAVAPPRIDPSLVPRKVFWGNADHRSVRVSPDGQRIAWLAPVGTVLNAWVAPAHDLASARPVTHEAARSLHGFEWAATSEHLLYGTPDVFACGIDNYGVANIVTRIEAVPDAAGVAAFTRLIGDPRTEEGRKSLLEHSPITYAGAITKPLLVSQGSHDPRVIQADSDRMVAAMQARGLPVTYLVYPDEGHGFQREENLRSLFAVSEAFLAQCLGGRTWMPCKPRKPRSRTRPSRWWSS